jgi:hypothetical protein
LPECGKPVGRRAKIVKHQPTYNETEEERRWLDHSIHSRTRFCWGQGVPVAFCFQEERTELNSGFRAVESDRI